MNGGAFSSMSTISALAAGTFNIIAMDSKACQSAQITQVLDDPTGIPFSFIKGGKRG